jgi:hypothetical protein
MDLNTTFVDKIAGEKLPLFFVLTANLVFDVTSKRNRKDVETFLPRLFLIS